MPTRNLDSEAGVRVLAGIVKLQQNFEFVVDENNRTQINDLLKYFYGQPGELDRAKGLLLHGPLGTGKSALMVAFRFWIAKMKQLTANSDDFPVFKLETANRIMKQFSAKGWDGIERYGWNNSKPMHLCIDDVGTDGTANSYGNSANVIADLLQDRYDIWKQKGMITHITTNLGVSQIKEKYGDRVYSRLCEIMNFVSLTGNDRRKNK